MNHRQLKTVSQSVAGLGRRLTALDYRDHFVDIADGDNQTLQNMLALAAVVQFALGALDDKLALISDVIGNYVQQPQRFGLAARDRDHVHAERSREVRGLEQHG